MYVCIHVCVCMYVYAFMYVCMDAYMYACMYVIKYCMVWHNVTQ